MDCFNPCSWSHRKFEIKNCEEKKVEGIFSHYALFFVHFEASVVFLSFRSFDLVEGKGEKKKRQRRYWFRESTEGGRTLITILVETKHRAKTRRMISAVPRKPGLRYWKMRNGRLEWIIFTSPFDLGGCIIIRIIVFR